MSGTVPRCKLVGQLRGQFGQTLVVGRWRVGIHVWLACDGGSCNMRPQPPHGPQVAHAGGRLADGQGLGHVAIRQLFEVPHQHDFAIGVVERFDGCLETDFQFVMRGRGGRRQLAIAHQRRQVERRAIVARRVVERLLARRRCAGPRDGGDGRRSADRGPGAAAIVETACRTIRDSRANRRLASTITSCTISLASSRRCKSRSMRRPTMRRSDSRCRSSSRLRASASPVASRGQQLLRFGGIGPHSQKYSRRHRFAPTTSAGCHVLPPIV